MTAVNPPSWEIRREIRPGTFKNYAHGYWRPFVIHVMGRTIIGKRALRKLWEAVPPPEEPQP